ncbi:MAG: hypothetical protein WCX65_15885 [bacterium]
MKKYFIKIFLVIAATFLCASAAAAVEAPYHFVVKATGVSPEIERRVKSEADGLMEKAAKFIGHEPAGPYFIYIAKTPEQFGEYSGGGAPDWAVAIYETRKRSVVIRPAGFNTQPEEFISILQHELVHAVLDSQFRDNPDALPRWLNEGLAVSLSQTWEVPLSWNQRKTTLYAALRKGGALDFDDISSDFPIGNLMAQMAYTQSYDFTQFILRTGGEKRMRRLLSLLAGGEPKNSAWRKVYGKPFGEIVDDWKFDVERPGGLIWVMHFFAAFDTYIWSGIALLTVIAATRVFLLLRRRKRRKIASDSDRVYDPEDDWDDLDEEWDPDQYGFRPWRPGRRR